MLCVWAVLHLRSFYTRFFVQSVPLISAFPLPLSLSLSLTRTHPISLFHAHTQRYSFLSDGLGLTYTWFFHFLSFHFIFSSSEGFRCLGWEGWGATLHPFAPPFSQESIKMKRGRKSSISILNLWPKSKVHKPTFQRVFFCWVEENVFWIISFWSSSSSLMLCAFHEYSQTGWSAFLNE